MKLKFEVELFVMFLAFFLMGSMLAPFIVEHSKQGAKIYITTK